MLRHSVSGATRFGSIGVATLLLLLGVLWSPAAVASPDPEEQPADARAHEDGGDEPGNLSYAQVRKPSDDPPRRTRRLTPEQRKALKQRASSRSQRDPRGATPTQRSQSRRTSSRQGEPVSSRLNLDLEDIDKPPEERTYTFSIVDGTYKDLVENFGRMAGLPVLGEAPPGTVNFVSTETLDFKEALARVRRLLFKYSPIEPYWLQYKGDHLEVVRVTDIWRDISTGHLFMNIEDFEESGIDDTELAMLLYTPRDTSVSDFTLLRDFMPDYVRIAPMEDTNSLAIFALVRDIKKYLELIHLFEGAGADPRVLKKIPVRHLAASQAVETLRVLMDDLDEGGQRRPRRGRTGDQAIDLPGQRTILFPDDAQEVIVVRAVPRMIEEIKEMLAFIDVDLGVEVEPVLIPVEYVPVSDLIATIRPLVAAGEVTSTPDTSKAAGARTRRSRSRRPGLARAEAVKSGGLVLLPVERTNTLVVLGSNEQVADVRRFVALFDVPNPSDQPVFVELEHATPEYIAGVIPQVIGRGEKAPDQLKVIGDAMPGTVILVGNKQDVEAARDLIATLDVPGENVRLHSFRLQNASPSAVMELIAMVDAQEAAAEAATPAAKGARTRRVGRGATAKGANLHVDEAAMTVYVLCTDKEWTDHYMPLIQRLDEEAAEPAPFARIELTYADPEELIGMLTPLVGGKPRQAGAQPKLVAATGAIIVTEATPAEIAHLRALVAELDQPTDGRELRLFEIQYADPNELQAILQSGVIGNKSIVRSGRVKRRAPAGDEAPVITVLGQTMVVSALPQDMGEIADLIGQLDVEGRDDTVLRVYAVPTGLDVDNVAAHLESLVSESPSARRRGAKAAGAPEDVRIVSQAVSRRLFIRAPVGRFAEIEDALELLLEGDAPEEFRVEFIELEYSSAEAIAPLIEPILQQREKELIAVGEITEDVDPTKPRQRRNPTASSVVTVKPDVDGGRLIVTGPSPIVAEARILVEQLDRPDSDGDRIMRVITLKRTTPEEIVNAVGAMLKENGGTANRPRRPRVRRAGAKDGARIISQTSEDVTVTAAPGGGAVIVSGYPDDVDEVERWIRMLDEDAVPEKTLKVYHIERADLDRLAESVLALCDDVGGPRAAKGRLQQESEFDLFDTSGIRRGNEITLALDYFSRIIVARATPAKMYEIDNVVALYEGTEEGEEPIIEGGDRIPFLVFELQNADAYDAAYQLEELLKVLWPYPSDVPDVDYVSGTNQLVVKCLPEHEAFIEETIAKYVDKETTKAAETKRVFKTVTGTTPSQLAMRLKMAMPNIQVDVERIGEEIPPMEQVRPYRPSEPEQCILPQSLARTLQGVCAAPLGQSGQEPPTEEQPQEEPVAEQGIEQQPDADRTETAEKMMDALLGGANDPAPTATEAETESDETESGQQPEKPIIVRFDDRAGMIVIEGSPRDVEEVEDALDDLLSEIKEISHKPDIRVFRIKYRDVNVAANILESMFGSGRNVQQIGGARTGAAAQAQMRRMQQMQQQMARMRQQMLRQQQQGQQQPEEPGVQIDPRTGLPIRPEDEEDKEEKKGPGEIRVLPDPQTRTLIIRAATEDFPIIVELLAIVDRPPDFESKHKIFKLTKLRAADVEEQLKVLLGIGQSSRPSSRRTTSMRGVRRGGRQNAALQQIEDALLNLNLGASGEGAINAASDILITSNERANTLLVMAPVAALELVGDLIEELEGQEIPVLETRTYVMQNADAADIASQLKEIYGTRSATGSADVFDPLAVNEATFVAEPRTNTLYVRALGPDFEKIEPIINELDRDLGDREEVMSFVLTNADAQQVAQTMNQAYATGRGRGAKSQAIKFVGDTGANTLLVIAPEHLRAEIRQRIEEMDEQAGGIGRPKAVQLTTGSAVDVAATLQEVFGRGGRGSGIRIVGDESTKQVFITAPNSLVPQIEEYARSLDTPSIDVSVRTFPLKHAKATEVHEQLMSMVRDAARQIRNKSGLGVFTATADPRTNSIVVLGSPESFMMVEDALRKIDTAPSEEEQVVTGIYHLTNADATEVARNITVLYRERGRRGGETLTAEANRANNSIIVRGPKAQVDEVYTQMIKPLEEQAAGVQRAREIVTLDHGQAVEVARTINDELNRAKGGKRREGQEPLAVIANESLNSIVISGPQQDVDDLAALARSLDQEPPIAKERVTRVYDIKYADPNSLVNTMKNIYRPQRGQRPEEAVDLGYDWGTSKLVVTALPETHEEIAQMLADVDIESTTVRAEHVIKLEYANAQELARNLQSMFSRNIRGGRGEQGVNIVGDLGTNALIVYANEEELNRIVATVEELDVPPVEAENREIRSFTLANTNPWVIADALKQIYRPRGRQANPRDEVVAVPEGTTMSVIVSASQERMEEIQKIVDEFDKPGASDSNVQVLEIKHADAAAVAQALQQVFVDTGGRNVRGQATVQISNPRGSNIVVVKANEQKYAEILKTIEELDSATGELGEIEVIALQHMDAEIMQETLQEYLRKSGQQGRNTELVGDVRLTSNPDNNTIIIAGEPEEVARLKEVVAKLDVEVEGAGNAPRIINLKHARAAQIEPVLTQMFVEGGRQGRGRRGGRGGGGAGSSSMVPVITADEMSNSLIVRASPTDFNMIEDLIADLDVKSTADETGFMLIPVAEGVNVVDLAALVESTINEGERIRAENYPGMEPGTLVVNPDVRSGALVLSGTPQLFKEAQRLTESVIAMGPTGRLSSRVIDLQNRSPDEIKRLLDMIIEENSKSQGGTNVQRSSRRPSSRSSGRRPGSRGSAGRRR